MKTAPLVLKTDLIPERTRCPSFWNSGPLWSMTARSMARKMRSGTGVGPGICKKWRPAILGVLVGIGAQMLGLLGVFLSHVLGLYTRPQDPGSPRPGRRWKARPHQANSLVRNTISVG